MKKRIFICSTSHDLHDVRTETIAFIKQLGFEAIAFEEPDFPVSHGLHSHDICLDAINRCDAYVIIIDGRYGGIYAGEKYPQMQGISITHAESRLAFETQKPVFTFVRRAVYDERATYQENVKSGSQIRPFHAKDTRVFDLIDEIIRRQTDNWVWFFHDSVHLKSLLFSHLKEFGLEGHLSMTMPTGKTPDGGQSMSLSKEWFSAVRGSASSDIVKPYMLGTFALPFHYEMLSDADRVYAFERAIDSIVDKDHVVLDVGTGSGILALLAARKASRVYAIEMDPTLAAIAAQNFRLSPNRQKLVLLVGNATELNLPEQVDIVICEMMDTVMLNEAQVPVLREVVKRLLKPNGKVIPSSIVNMGALTHSKFEFYGVVQMRVPHYERSDLPSSDMLSGWQKISTVNFGSSEPDLVEALGTFMSPTGGCVNSLMLKTIVHFGDGSTLGPCPTLNVPVVIPIEEDVELKAGQSCEVYIRYQHFDTFNNVTCKVVAL